MNSQALARQNKLVQSGSLRVLGINGAGQPVYHPSSAWLRVTITASLPRFPQ
jgi:hypothetical protein